MHPCRGLIRYFTEQLRKELAKLAQELSASEASHAQAEKKLQEEHATLIRLTMK